FGLEQPGGRVQPRGQGGLAGHGGPADARRPPAQRAHAGLVAELALPRLRAGQEGHADPGHADQRQLRLPRPPPLGGPVMRGVAPGCPVPPLAGGLVPAAAPEPASADEKLLRDNKAPTDGPELLEYLRKRFDSPISDEEIRALVEQLGDDSFHKREDATRR